jgi:hypothetical protein
MSFPTNEKPDFYEGLRLRFSGNDCKKTVSKITKVILG